MEITSGGTGGPARFEDLLAVFSGLSRCCSFELYDDDGELVREIRA